jgi:hypothetical protein
MSELEILRIALSDIADMLGENREGKRSESYVCGYVDAVVCRAMVDAEMASEREIVRQNIRGASN